MDLTPALHEDKQIIQRYGGGSFVVSGAEFRDVIFLHDNTISQVAELDAQRLTAQQLISALEGISADILLIGTGKTQHFIPPTIRREVATQTGAVIEAMDTGAACRTYNVLTAEDRRIAALLFPV